MNPTILVTGGTGNLGSHVVPLLVGANQPIRLLSRHQHGNATGIEYAVGDTVAGVGLKDALKGIKTVLHLAGGPKGDDVATRNLVREAKKAGIDHLVMISVIGADTMPIGYFRAKQAAEEAVIESGVPWTILRAAQFHDFVATTIGKMAKMPLVPVPTGLRFEPVDVTEVAARIAELTLGPPQGRVSDLAGPEVLGVGQILDSIADSGGPRRPRFRMRIPGKIGKAYRAGDNLAGPEVERSGRNWARFVESQAGERGRAAA